MPKFIKKPEIVEAVQYNGKNGEGVAQLAGYSIKLLIGIDGLKVGDWVVKNGHRFYIKSSKDFKAAYEEVEE